MQTLVLGFYAEGPTDERFLPIIIQRTAEEILLQRSPYDIEVLEPFNLRTEVKRSQVGSQAKYILLAARRSAGYHALIVHVDADHRTHDAAMNERILPGFKLVEASDDETCEQLIPIIPIRMTEAWMLADPEAFKEVIGTGIEAQKLGLPTHPHQVEAEADPKKKLREAIKLALGNRGRRRRRQSIGLGDIYEPLARKIRLKQLSLVPAYQRFVDDLTASLIALHLVK